MSENNALRAQVDDLMTRFTALENGRQEMVSRLEAVEQKANKTKRQYYQSLKRVAENYMAIKRNENRLYLLEVHASECTKRRRLSEPPTTPDIFLGNCLYCGETMGVKELFIHMRGCQSRPYSNQRTVLGSFYDEMANNGSTEIDDSVALETEEVVNDHLRSLQTDEPSISTAWPVEEIIEQIIEEGDIIDLIEQVE